MKNINLLLIVLLLLIVSGLSAKSQKIKAEQDTTRLRLFETVSQKVQINCTNLTKRIYFINDIVLSRADVEAKKLCFMLNADFIISDVTINDVSIPIRKYRNINSEGFNPNIDPELFKQIKKNVALYEFVMDDLKKSSEHIEVRLKYHLIDRESNKVYTNYKDKLIMRGLEFWYPRNLNKDENVQLTVKTTDQISFSLNAKAVTYTRPKRYLKEYRTSFTDLKDDPAMIIFMK